MSIRRLATLLFCVGLVACAKTRGGEPDSLVVAADPAHAALLETIRPQVAEQGVRLKIERFKDGSAVAEAVLDRRADAALGPTRVGLQRLNAGGETELIKVTAVDRPGVESNDGPHVAYLVARADRQNDLRIRKLASTLTTSTVKSFIQDRSAGFRQPAF